MKLNNFTAAGDSKVLLTEVLRFIISTNQLTLEGFYIDRTGYLVFCEYVGEGETKYPYEQTPVSLTEHIYQYITSLSDEELASMGCEPSGYEEDYSIGWEIFIPDYCSDNYDITDYTWGKTVLAVKPKLIEYGK
jgi:hypothetical protein